MPRESETFTVIITPAAMAYPRAEFEKLILGELVGLQETIMRWYDTEQDIADLERLPNAKG